MSGSLLFFWLFVLIHELEDSDPILYLVYEMNMKVGLVSVERVIHKIELLWGYSTNELFSSQ